MWNVICYPHTHVHMTLDLCYCVLAFVLAFCTSNAKPRIFNLQLKYHIALSCVQRCGMSLLFSPDSKLDRRDKLPIINEVCNYVHVCVYSLTLGAHAQRGLRYLVSVSVCLCVCVRYQFFCHHALQCAQQDIPSASAGHEILNLAFS